MGAFKKIHFELMEAKRAIYVTDIIQDLSKHYDYSFFELYKIYEDVLEKHEQKELRENFNFTSFILEAKQGNLNKFSAMPRRYSNADLKTYITDIIKSLSEITSYSFYDLYIAYENYLDDMAEGPGWDFDMGSFISCVLSNDNSIEDYFEKKTCPYSKLRPNIERIINELVKVTPYSYDELYGIYERNAFDVDDPDDVIDVTSFVCITLEEDW